MAETPEQDPIRSLSERIDAAKEAQAPKPGKRVGEKYEKASLAWRMVIELVVGMGLGFAIGLGLDSVFGTQPIMIAIFSVLGLAAGIRTMMRTAEEVQKAHEGGSTANKD